MKLLSIAQFTGLMGALQLEMENIETSALEKAAVIVTTNLPFSEWTTMFPNARLCKAMVDRLTDQAHIIDTGDESYRFRRTLEKKRGGAKR